MIGTPDPWGPTRKIYRELTGTDRLPRGSGVRRSGIAAIAIALLVLGCGGRDPAPYVATLDGLDLPSNWGVAQTTVQSQGGANGCIEALNARCPTVVRYFVVAGELTDVLSEAEDAVGAAGFGSIDVRHPACDSTLSGPRCSFDGAKEGMAIQVNVYPPGEDVEGLGLARPGLAMVRMTLNRH
jgi:hypothetical protein